MEFIKKPLLIVVLGAVLYVGVSVGLKKFDELGEQEIVSYPSKPVAPIRVEPTTPTAPTEQNQKNISQLSEQNLTEQNISTIEEINTSKAPAPDGGQKEGSTAEEQSVSEYIGCYRVEAAALNVREEPTVNSPIINKAYEGDIVCARSKEGGWLETDFGWMWGRLTQEVKIDPKEQTNLNQRAQ